MYNKNAAPAQTHGKEVKLMLTDFLISVLASLVAALIADLVRKWLG